MNVYSCKACVKYQLGDKTWKSCIFSQVKFRLKNSLVVCEFATLLTHPTCKQTQQQCHGHLDSTDLWMIPNYLLWFLLAHSLPICLMAFLWRAVPDHKCALWPGVQNSEVLHVDLNLSIDGKPVPSAFAAQHLGTSFSESKKNHFLETSQHWNASNWATKRTANFVGFVSPVFFPVGRHWLRKRELKKPGSYWAHMSNGL